MRCARGGASVGLTFLRAGRSLALSVIFTMRIICALLLAALGLAVSGCAGSSARSSGPGAAWSGQSGGPGNSGSGLVDYRQVLAAPGPF